MKETWKDVEGFENVYQISNLGRLKRLETIIKSKYMGKYNRNVHKYEKIINVNKNERYYKYTLKYKNKKRVATIHRLVAEAFIPNPNNLPQVNHIDGNKHNNNVENLEWCTQSQNIRHAQNVLNKIAKKVLQIERNTGKIVNEYKSTVEAMQQTKVDRTNISKCCNGKCKTAGGFIWKYVN